HQAIDDMSYLSDEQKEAAHQAVNDATGVEGLEQALADATSDNLDGAKDSANKAIDAMDNLSQDEKDAAHQAVNDATDIAGVEKAQADAASLNAENEPSILEDIISGIWNAIIAIPKGLLEALKSVIPMLSDYHFLLETAPAALTGAALIAWEAFVEVIHVPLSFISNMVQWVTGFITGILGGIWGPLGTIPQIFNGILILVDGLANGFKIIVESIGVGLISLPAIITGAIGWVITLVKGFTALLNGDSSAMEDFVSDFSQSLLQNPLIPLALGDLFVAIMAIPKLGVEAISVIAEWILGIITGVMQFIPGLIPVVSVLSDFTLAIDGVLIAIHYGLSNVVNLITKLGMALIMGLPIAMSTGTSAINLIEAFIKGMLGLNTDSDTPDTPINSFIDSLIDFISSPIEGVKNIFSSISNSIQDFFKDPAAFIGNMIQSAIDVILAPCKFIIDAVGSIIDFIVSPFEAIGKVIGNLIECIGDFLSDPFGAIGNVFQDIMDIILAPCKFFIDTVSSIFNFITNPIDSIVKLLGDPLTLMVKFISDPVGTVTDLFNSVIDGILSPFKGIIDFISEVIYGITHPLETISNLINDIVAKIFGGSSNDNVAASSLNTLAETVESAAEAAKPAAESLDKLLVSAEKAVDNLLEQSVGEGSERSLSTDDLSNITSTLNELATYSDSNVTSLNEMVDSQASQASQDSQASKEAVNEELTDEQLASLTEENNANEINLDSLVGEENNSVVAENKVSEQQQNVEDSGEYNALNQVVNQLQLNEEHYQFAAA
ncbi:hypothetical protein WJC50_000790, partial [Klebsiella aerogenes]